MPIDIEQHALPILKYFLAGSGLALAVVDFFGFDHSIEEFLDKKRTQYEISVSKFKEWIDEKTSVILTMIFGSFIVLSIGIKIYYGVKILGVLEGWEYLFPYFSKAFWLMYWEGAKYFFLSLGIAILVFLSLRVVPVLVLQSMVYLMRAMDKSRKGTYGTIGLFLAVGSFTFDVVE